MYSRAQTVSPFNPRVYPTPDISKFDLSPSVIYRNKWQHKCSCLYLCEGAGTPAVENWHAGGGCLSSLANTLLPPVLQLFCGLSNGCKFSQGKKISKRSFLAGENWCMWDPLVCMGSKHASVKRWHS